MGIAERFLLALQTQMQVGLEAFWFLQVVVPAVLEARYMWAQVATK